MSSGSSVSPLVILVVCAAAISAFLGYKHSGQAMEMTRLRQDVRRGREDMLAALQRRDRELSTSILSLRDEIRSLASSKPAAASAPVAVPAVATPPVPPPTTAAAGAPQPEPAAAPQLPKRVAGAAAAGTARLPTGKIVAAAPFCGGYPTDSSCPDWLGIKSLERFRRPPKMLCANSTPSQAWLQCVNADRHDIYLCSGGNLRTTPGTYSLVSLERRQYMVSQGALRGQCTVDNSFKPPQYAVAYEHLNRWLNSFTGGAAADLACKDTDNIIEEPTLAVWRVDFYNPYHSHEDFLAVWKTYVHLNLNPQKMGVLFVDFAPDGPYLDLWKRAFAPVHGVRRIDTLNAMKRPSCFRNVVFSIPALSGVGFNIGRNDRICHSSPILKGYRKFVLASFQIEPVRRPPQVLVLARRIDPPGRPRLLRRMTNRDQLVSRLRQVCAGAGCELKDVDFPSINIREQVRRASEADIMIGTHGAALTFCLFMPTHGTLIEYATGADFHYANMARYAGLSYVQLRGTSHGSPSFIADVSATAAAVINAVPAVKAALAGGSKREDAYPAEAFA